MPMSRTGKAIIARHIERASQGGMCLEQRRFTVQKAANFMALEVDPLGIERLQATRFSTVGTGQRKKRRLTDPEPLSLLSLSLSRSCFSLSLFLSLSLSLSRSLPLQIHMYRERERERERKRSSLTCQIQWASSTLLAWGLGSEQDSD